MQVQQSQQRTSLFRICSANKWPWLGRQDSLLLPSVIKLPIKSTASHFSAIEWIALKWSTDILYSQRTKPPLPASLNYFPSNTAEPTAQRNNGPDSPTVVTNKSVLFAFCQLFLSNTLRKGECAICTDLLPWKSILFKAQNEARDGWFIYFIFFTDRIFHVQLSTHEDWTNKRRLKPLFNMR